MPDEDEYRYSEEFYEQFDYTIPEGFGYLVYEFSCDIGGNPATRRGKIQRTWDD
ncbi:MAG: hypothetical protein ACLFUH_00445 [Bacteroidales bacterium]